MVGVADDNNPDSRAAGMGVARAALGQLGDELPGFAIAFVGGQLDGDQWLAGAREVLPGVPLVGGAAVGTMTHESIGSTGYECAIAVLPACFGEPRIVSVNGLGHDEEASGRALGEKLAETVTDDDCVLLFYDSVKSSPPPELHIASRLLAGLNHALGSLRPLIAGGGTLADLELSDSYVYDGTGLVRHTAVAIVLPPSVRASSSIMHGCEPVSSFLEITSAEGAVVYELDGRPAAEVLAERLGTDVDTLSRFEESLAITLGAKVGDPFGPFDEADYVNRMVVGVDAECGSVTLFEADFEVGARVQIMTTSIERMNASAAERTSALLSDDATLAGNAPQLGLYIDCAGRAPSFCGADAEEADLVRERIGALCPMIGFYSGVEIAAVQGVARPLDWTGVLSVFVRG